MGLHIVRPSTVPSRRIIEETEEKEKERKDQIDEDEIEEVSTNTERAASIANRTTKQQQSNDTELSSDQINNSPQRSKRNNNNNDNNDNQTTNPRRTADIFAKLRRSPRNANYNPAEPLRVEEETSEDERVFR